MKSRTCMCLCVLAFAGIFSAADSLGQESAPRPRPEGDIIHVGYLKDLFSDVDIRDAQVAIELWIGQVSEEMRLPVLTETVFFDDVPAVVKAIKAGDIDVVPLPPLDFLEIRDTVALEPLAVGVSGGTVTDEYVILVHRSRGISALKQLKDMKLMAESGRYARAVAFMWLDTLLMREGLGRKEDLFGAIREGRRAAQAILSVFFGQVEACLVTRRSLETVSELNPQVGRELTVLCRSPGFVREIMCGRKGYDETRKRVLMDGALRFQRYPKGQQILGLFGLDGVVPFGTTYLDPIVRLVEEHSNLERGATADGKAVLP